MNLEEVRTGLERKRRNLLGEMERVESDLHALEDNVEIEREDEVQEGTIAQVLAGLDDRARREVEAIDRALVRIARGQYGRCLTCREAIPAERLLAVPTAERCTECAAALEE